MQQCSPRLPESAGSALRSTGEPAKPEVHACRRGGCLARHGPCGGDGLEAGVHAERLKETSHVVPDRLRAQVELGGDLLVGAALLQEPKHLGLTGSEMRRWRYGPVVRAFLDQSEDADHAFARASRYRAINDREV